MKKFNFLKKIFPVLHKKTLDRFCPFLKINAIKEALHCAI